MSTLKKPCRRGVTLVELLVALVLLALLSTVVTQTPRLLGHKPTTLSDRVDSMRRKAVQSGKSVVVFLRDSARSGDVLVLPTGSILADSTLRVAPLTGQVQP